MTYDGDLHDRLAPMFTALCVELGFCLHDKGERRVVEALPQGLDYAVKAVFQADGMDMVSAPGDLKRAVRDCIKAHARGAG
jgi:hypothetical protein